MTTTCPSSPPATPVALTRCRCAGLQVPAFASRTRSCALSSGCGRNARRAISQPGIQKFAQKIATSAFAPGGEGHSQTKGQVCGPPCLRPRGRRPITRTPEPTCEAREPPSSPLPLGGRAARVRGQSYNDYSIAQKGTLPNHTTGMRDAHNKRMRHAREHVKHCSVASHCYRQPPRHSLCWQQQGLVHSTGGKKTIGKTAGSTCKHEPPNVITHSGDRSVQSTNQARLVQSPSSVITAQGGNERAQREPIQRSVQGCSRIIGTRENLRRQSQSPSQPGRGLVVTRARRHERTLFFFPGKLAVVISEGTGILFS